MRTFSSFHRVRRQGGLGAAALGLAGVALATSACAISVEDELDLGISAQEVRGGTLTTNDPAVAFLKAEFSDGTYAMCSGTLISERVILTAAHCLDLGEEPVKFTAYFGADARERRRDEAHIATIDILDTTFHSEWDLSDPRKGHDVGLALLAEPAPVQPMPIARLSPYRNIPTPVGEPVRVVGWGRTSGARDDYGQKREALSALTSKSDLLLLYGSPEVNTCQFDSGGPDLMEVDGLEVIAGITSYSDLGCDSFAAGTNVATFAADYIDPWVAANDPAGACIPDQVCNELCGDADPDCRIVPEPDHGDGDRPADELDPLEDQEQLGGCSAGGTAPGSCATLLSLALVVLLWQRRRRAA